MTTREPEGLPTFVPTGEVRVPKRGEWFMNGRNLWECDMDLGIITAPIYRRAPAERGGESFPNGLQVRFTALPGGPDCPPCEFVELEDGHGRGIGGVEWKQDGNFALLVLAAPAPPATSEPSEEEIEAAWRSELSAEAMFVTDRTAFARGYRSGWRARGEKP